MNGSLYLPRQTETPAKMSHGHLQAVNYFIIIYRDTQWQADQQSGLGINRFKLKLYVTCYRVITLETKSTWPNFIILGPPQYFTNWLLRGCEPRMPLPLSLFFLGRHFAFWLISPPFLYRSLANLHLVMYGHTSRSLLSLFFLFSPYLPARLLSSRAGLCYRTVYVRMCLSVTRW